MGYQPDNQQGYQPYNQPNNQPYPNSQPYPDSQPYPNSQPYPDSQPYPNSQPYPPYPNGQPGYQPNNQGPYNPQGYQQPYYQAAAPQYVGVGRRFVALFIDGIIIGIISDILASIFHSQSVTSGLIFLLITWIYYSALEGSRGATLGKMIMGIRVINQDGSAITWSQAIVRNLLRIIDALPFLYLVGAILIWTSPTKQRLGDRAVHTYVVRKNN